MCVTGFSVKFSYNTASFSPYHVQGRCWPGCPGFRSARAENLRMEEMRSCSQACVSDDGLVSLAALGPHNLSSHGSDVAPNEPKSLCNATRVNTSYFPFHSFYFTFHHCVPPPPSETFFSLVLQGWWATVSFVSQVRWELPALLLTP